MKFFAKFALNMKIDWSKIPPRKDELPSCYADRIGKEYTASVTVGSKKDKGQFFTPTAIAQFMSQQFSVPTSKKISILDPGCGTAILSCTTIEYAVKHYNIEDITLVVYETDEELLPILHQVLEYIQEWGKKQTTNINYQIYTTDFILKNYTILYPDTFYSKDKIEYFDWIISNPPYFKLSKEDKRVKAAECIVNGQPNIYALFMAISALLLKKEGEMVYITPRSFTSGRYFRLFRKFFFKHISLDFIHLFNTRKGTFSRDKVLQETLIMKCSPRKKADSPITLSYSEGLNDLEVSRRTEWFQSELIDFASKEQILHLPITEKDKQILALFKSWKGSLNQYQIQISTGPVVAFRCKEELSSEKTKNTVCLYWLHNVIKMLTDHPIIKKDKPQFIKVNETSRSTLLPNKNYVLLRRFSSKDDNNRLIAAPYFGNMMLCSYVGVENKLNYIYRPQGHLNRMEVMGITALLNSSLFDDYFRMFNGNVNVSATELREMPMPPLKIIENIGKDLIIKNEFSEKNASSIVNKYFNIL